MILSPEEQIKILKRNLIDFVSEEELLHRLKSGKPLRVKLGVDPSRPDLHLGHAVVLRKLKQFQDLGHKVVLIIGDFTARIGDPSGKSKTRPMLSMQEVKEYAITYEQQVYRILDKDKIEIRFNGEWLDKMSFEDVIRLAAKYTLARMMERDDFSKRYRDNEPICVAELLYPLAQAYDSVAIEADIEIGGTDQLFNLLVGRKIQEDYGLKSQIVMTLPLIEGTDGHTKMSKSANNYIAFNDTPNDVFGKIMSIPDELIIKYFRLLTDISEEDLGSMQKQMSDGSVNPRDLKMNLGVMMVQMLYTKEEGQSAREEFIQVFQKKDLPSDIPDLVLECSSMKICDLLIRAGVSSKSEAKRLIMQGGVTIDEVKIDDINFEVQLKNDSVLRVGKRKFFKIKNDL